MTISMLVILSGAAMCTVTGWLYFRHIQLPRPPIGVFSLSDVLILFGFIILIPMLYIWLPKWMLMGLLGISGLSLVYFALEPIRHRALRWLLTLVVIGADLACGFGAGTQHPVYQAINNLFVIVAVVSISNTWAQAGMKARDAAVLGGLLIAYDFIATVQLPVMGDLFGRLNSLPLAPLLAWGQGASYAAVGLGDLLMLTVFPLTMYKGFGIRAGLTALVIGLISIVLLLSSPLQGIFPVMVILGPLMIVQYGWWRRGSPERPMKMRLAANPTQATP